MQCYLMPDETALRELSENVIDKLKLLTDEQFAEIEFPMDRFLPPAGGLHIIRKVTFPFRRIVLSRHNIEIPLQEMLNKRIL